MAEQKREMLEDLVVRIQSVREYSAEAGVSVEELAREIVPQLEKPRRIEAPLGTARADMEVGRLVFEQVNKIIEEKRRG